MDTDHERATTQGAKAFAIGMPSQKDPKTQVLSAFRWAALTGLALFISGCLPSY